MGWDLQRREGMWRQGNSAGKMGGGVKPSLDKSVVKAQNLRVLRRMDPLVEEILLTVSHVTLYRFDVDLNQWERKDVEGTLFVVQRNSHPKFQFIVLNRRCTGDLIEAISEDFECEVQAPYLLYTTASGEINGVWFYEAHYLEEVANLLNSLHAAS